MEKLENVLEPQSEFEMEGWKYSFHPRPGDTDANSWFEIITEQYKRQNRQIESVSAAVEHIYDDPGNPMYRKVIDTVWGVEVQWR